MRTCTRILQTDKRILTLYGHKSQHIFQGCRRNLRLISQHWSSFLWIKNPYTENIVTKLPGTLSSGLYGELIDISATSLRAHFIEVSLESFCCETAAECLMCHDAAVKVLTAFTTTYLCDAVFSAMTAIKTKYRASLSIKDHMWLALSKICPCINRIISCL